MSEAVLADLARVKALFQARTVALVLGAEPPSPAVFHSEVNKDRTAREDFVRRPGCRYCGQPVERTQEPWAIACLSCADDHRTHSEASAVND